METLTIEVESRDAAGKGPARAFDAMRRDLNRRRERCVRLDPPPPTASPAGAAAAPGALPHGGGAGG